MMSCDDEFDDENYEIFNPMLWPENFNLSKILNKNFIIVKTRKTIIE